MQEQELSEKTLKECISKEIKHIINFILAYIVTFAIYNLGNFETSNILLGVLLVAFYFAISKVNILDMVADRNQIFAAHIVSVIWTLSYWIYAGDSLKNGLENKVFALFYVVMSIVGLYALFFLVIRFVIVRQSDSNIQLEQSYTSTFSTKTWLIYSVIVLLIMLPLFLLNFPGTMTVDSFDQLSQARGLTVYSDHHPWIHTLTIHLFYSIGYGLTGSVSVGIGTYTLVQMIIVALSVGYAIASMAEVGFGRKWQLLILFGYILYPYHLAYAITMWKDIIFSAAILVLGVTMYRLFVCGKAGSLGIRDSILFAISSLAMCTLRHNGFYAYVLTVAVVAIVLLVGQRNKTGSQSDSSRTSSDDKKGPIKLVLISFTIIIITLVINRPVQKACGVAPSDYGHNLAIPLQQIGRTVALNGDVSDDDLAKLEKINSIQYIKNNYEPGGADNMIQWLVAGDSEYMQSHKGEYIGLWIRLGLKNPVSYFEAFVEQTKGYYTTMMPEQIAYYGILPNNDGLETQPLIGATVRIKINELCSKIQDVLPVYAILYSVGACVMLLILGAGIVICRRQYSMLLVYLPYVALMLSIIVAAPLVADLRYGYSFMLSMPTLIVMTIGKRNC